VDPWLTKARDALAEEAGVAPDELELSEADEEILLDIARIAAHASGDRTNAPLLCYLVGRAAGNSDLSSLADALRRSTS
jgi:Domain of unknown function (DUF6457)